ncbi:MAG: MlaD family protein [Rhizomicrobium sp.]|jgi:phospholipid/cholesterol/gamma-HCH transport system substrate-binding protein
METRANYVAVGIFVLVCVAGLFVALLWLAGSQYTEEFAYYRTVFTGAVTGLGTGTTVRYNGIDVGHVSKLNFDPDDPKKVVVIMQIDPSLRLHSDSVATIASEGLTGGSYVEIDGGSKNAPILESQGWGDYPTIRSKPSTLQQLEQSAPQLLAKIDRIADRLNDLFNDKNRAAFAQTLSNLRDLTGDLSRHSADMDRILTNVSSASSNLNSDLVGMRAVIAHADDTTQKLAKLSADTDTAINGARVDELMGQTRDLVKSLTSLSDELKRDPSRLIYGDRRKGYTPP